MGRELNTRKTHAVLGLVLGDRTPSLAILLKRMLKETYSSSLPPSSEGWLKRPNWTKY